jgi:hypothetical protein
MHVDGHAGVILDAEYADTPKPGAVQQIERSARARICGALYIGLSRSGKCGTTAMSRSCSLTARARANVPTTWGDQRYFSSR